MGSESAVEIFNKIDKAWANFDYDLLKTFIADDAEMRFADGRVGVGPDEFIEIIKAWVLEMPISRSNLIDTKFTDWTKASLNLIGP